MNDTEIRQRPVHPEPPTEPAPVLLHVIDRGSVGEVRIHLKSFKGRRLVDVRLFEKRAGGVVRATEKGIAIRLGEVADLVRVLGALIPSPADDGSKGHA